MRTIGFIISLIVTVALVIVLDQSWLLSGSRIPPLGKFLDPLQGYWQNAEPKGYLPSESLDLDGLKAPVTVIYDSLFIPHIFAQNDEDLYMAQGYITAKYRLWQMEFQVMAGMGRISELIGDAALDFDRSQRRIGMTYGAEHALKDIEEDPESAARLTAYTRGVNAYIDDLNYARLPLEYKLMDYRPEKWSNLKSAVVVMNLNKTLSFSDKDIEMTNALKLFGKDLVDKLYPDLEGVGAPVVDRPGHWTFPPRFDRFLSSCPAGRIHRYAGPSKR